MPKPKLLNYPLPVYVVSAYYHSSETTYKFGPFFGDAALLKFLNEDPTPEKHERWFVSALNMPEAYGTGLEVSCDPM